MSLTGVALQLAYRLRRHLWLGWPLTHWLILLLIGAGLIQVLSGGTGLVVAAGLGTVLLGFVAIRIWATRRRYVHFEVQADGEDLPAGDPLRAEEWVPVRASGWFTVEGRGQYYVDLEADYETVGTGEHIVLGRVRPSRFLWLGRWPAHEWGWWYIFFQPGMIQELHPGYLHFGPQPRRALRIVYAPDAETREAIYLTFSDRQTQRRVWDDLKRLATEEEGYVRQALWYSLGDPPEHAPADACAAQSQARPAEHLAQGPHPVRLLRKLRRAGLLTRPGHPVRV